MGGSFRWWIIRLKSWADCWPDTFWKMTMSDDNDNFAPETANSDNPQAAELAVLDALRAESADLKDRLLRALADAENTRRRTEREKQDASQYAVTKFARDMLTIADNFARALAALPPEMLEEADPKVKGVIEGIEAAVRRLAAAQERPGVKLSDPPHSAGFGPDVDQANAEVQGSGKAAVAV